jgi:hypothetical protein
MSQADELAFLASLEKEYLQDSKGMASNPYSNSIQVPQKQNLVEWQLDFKESRLLIERLCRTDIRVVENGNITYKKNPDQSKVLLNEQGVNDVMLFLGPLLDKGTILSYYKDINEVHKIVYSIVEELRHMIYANQEVYGINPEDEYKANRYSALVIIADALLMNAYRRSLNGEERKGLGEARIVNQQDGVYNGGMYPQQQAQKGGLKKILPWNWGK